MSQTMVSAVFPSRTRCALGIRVLGFSLLVAACAQVKIFLPFTPVPITAQTFGVLLTGALLGSRQGSLALLLYLAEGAAGLPFFAGGSAGWPILAGPTGGYLLGFVPAAWLVGRLSEKGWDRDPFRAALAMALGSAVIFAFGLAGLSRFVPAGLLLSAGLYPFLWGDAAKICLGAVALPWGWKCVRWGGGSGE